LLASGQANGIRMMSDRGRARVLEQQSEGVDLALGAAIRWGIGYSLEVSLMPGVPAGARAAWWAGNGGSMAYVDLDARMSLAYYPNRWISGQHEMDRARVAIQAAYESLAAANGKNGLRGSRVA
jgi:CubicO group peptidase (beta-lactamase class C family)